MCVDCLGEAGRARNSGVGHEEQVGPAGQRRQAIADQAVAEVGGQDAQGVGESLGSQVGTFREMRANNDRWLCTTPLGSPVVPEVNRIRALSSRLCWIAVAGWPPARSRQVHRTGALSLPRGLLSTNTAAGAQKSTILESSGSVRPGFTQTAQPPICQTANRSAKKSGVLPWAMTKLRVAGGDEAGERALARAGDLGAQFLARPADAGVQVVDGDIGAGQGGYHARTVTGTGGADNKALFAQMLHVLPVSVFRQRLCTGQ